MICAYPSQQTFASTVGRYMYLLINNTSCNCWRRSSNDSTKWLAVLQSSTIISKRLRPIQFILVFLLPFPFLTSINPLVCHSYFSSFCSGHIKTGSFCCFEYIYMFFFCFGPPFVGFTTILLLWLFMTDYNFVISPKYLLLFVLF